MCMDGFNRRIEQKDKIGEDKSKDQIKYNPRSKKSPSLLSKGESKSSLCLVR